MNQRTSLQTMDPEVCADPCAVQAAAACRNDYGWDDTPWLEWKCLSGQLIDALDREKTVVLVSCSPLEVHGPHLPTFTDYVEADGIMFRTAQLLKAERPDLTFVHLPPIYVASDALPHVGSINFDPSTIVRVLTDLGRSLCKQGFKNIWVSSFHGGPRHFVAIERAAHKVNRRHGGRMVSLFGMLMSELNRGSTDLSAFLGERTEVSAEALLGDTHGGAVETSLMLHLVGQHVSTEYSELDRHTVDLELDRQGKEPLNQHQGKSGLGTVWRGLKAKLNFFEDYTFSGDPAISTQTFGKDSLEALATMSVAPLCGVLDGTLPERRWRSPLWKVRFLFSFGWLTWCFKAMFGRKRDPTW